MNTFYTLNQYIRNHYPYKLRKIPLNAGLTCPNRDGSLSDQGCFYCNNESFSPFVSSGENLSIREQVENYLKKSKKNDCEYIAYFQSFTNTYGTKKQLWDIYQQVLAFEKVKVISIGTRPDCINEDTMELISRLREHKEIWLEIGLQSSSNQILRLINRGHTVETFIKTCRAVRERFPELRLITHLIFGLPKELDEDIIKAAEIINELKISGVKIHPLTIVKNTKFAELYQNHEIKLISMEEYIGRVVLFLRHLAEDIVIERISEDSNEFLIAPGWANKKHQIKDEILKKLNRAEPQNL